MREKTSSFVRGKGKHHVGRVMAYFHSSVYKQEGIYERKEKEKRMATHIQERI